ncbi:uncharacterized protein VTP21DRAFT_4265 [Calcarisporiella thermophila]|uniref:uncharacterized protein n=1 Tax=Calcarisporiella thermophila TaxID=911321 RepID=UPI0037439438
MTTATKDHSSSDQPDLLTTLPTPVSRMLLHSRPLVRALLYVYQILAWTTNPSESMLLVLTWWCVCLWGKWLLVFGIPMVWVGAIVLKWLRGESDELRESHPPALTHQSLQQSIDDIELLNKRIKNVHSVFRKYYLACTRFESFVMVVALVPLWWIATWLIPMNIVLLILGTIALTWYSPWMMFLRWVGEPPLRFVISKLVSRTRLFGRRRGAEEMAALAVAEKEKEKEKQQAGGDSDKEEQELVFQFTLFENQRWWVGVGWTSMLLPTERPSWSDEYDEATNPKEQFQLPPPTTSLTASPTQPEFMIQTRTEWQWVDPEWRVSIPEPHEKKTEKKRVRKEDLADADGWEYADNYWRGFKGRSTVRSYTRRRRWVRSARLVEVVEKVPKPRVS